ncbi:MAG: helix-turn-helix transcriptional regulator [Cyanothece sp. SIO1E1]|nr:helix-turn-helix transcriptional regulator [Cyanothece sp. SIO1E1]
MNEIFDQTIKRYRINASELARRCNISPGHISKFRSGRGNLTTEMLESVLKEMEKMAPGSRSYFVWQLAGGMPDMKSQLRLMSPSELAQILTDVADSLNDQIVGKDITMSKV